MLSFFCLVVVGHPFMGGNTKISTADDRDEAAAMVAHTTLSFLFLRQIFLSPLTIFGADLTTSFLSSFLLSPFLSVGGVLLHVSFFYYYHLFTLLLTVKLIIFCRVLLVVLAPSSSFYFFVLFYHHVTIILMISTN